MLNSLRLLLASWLLMASYELLMASPDYGGFHPAKAVFFVLMPSLVESRDSLLALEETSSQCVK